jgi:ribosome-binding ATPase YchF (GTP1/OBG family)
VAHPEGRVDPVDDADLIETELLASDLEQAERRIEKVAKEAKTGDKAAVAEHAWLEQLIDALASGRPAREVPVPAAAPDAMQKLGSLTAKPVLYVANVEEGEAEVPPDLEARAKEVGAAAVAISARVESELRELDDDEAEEMRTELGIERSGLDRLIRAAFELLDLVSFFTAGEGKEAVAHAVERGTSAYDAAAEVHSDIQKAFIRAEVVAAEELIDAGGYSGARDRGTLRTEGREYVIQDGDVITIKV